MLAERKKRLKWSLNPRGNLWSQDSNKFGQRMLEKMGWKAGSGLGVNEQGITEHIKVAYKSDNKCIGYKEHGEEWIGQQSQFENLLSELSTSHSNSTTLDAEKGSESLEQKSRLSRARVHYQKFTRGKDLSKRSTEDLACILGVKKTEVRDEEERKNEDIDPAVGEASDLYGVTTIKGGSMSDYFSKIKNKFKSKIHGHAHEEIELSNDNLQNCETNILSNFDTTNIINVENKNKKKEIKMLQDDLIQTNSKKKNVQKNRFNDEIQSDFKLEKTVLDGNMLQEQQTQVTSKKKKKKYNSEATAEGNVNIEIENVNSKTDSMKKRGKKVENNFNDYKNGNSFEAMNSEQVNNMIDDTVANSESSDITQSCKRRKTQKSNHVPADVKITKIENKDFKASEINICKSKHKKSQVCSDSDVGNDDLEEVENRKDKTNINALKKKKKHKSDKFYEEIGEFINKENLDSVENEIDTDALKKKRRKKSISKMNEVTNDEILGTVENEVEESNANALKKERKKKSDLIKVNKEVVGSEILVESNIDVCKKKRKTNDEVLGTVENEVQESNANALKKERKKKSDVIEVNKEVVGSEILVESNKDVCKKKRKRDLSEENAEVVNGEILEQDENEMDISNPNTLKKKRKEKSDMSEMNEEIGSDISGIVKKEIDLSNTDVLKEKKRKKKNVSEENGELIIDDNLETIDKEIDINTLKKRKRKCKNKVLCDEKVDEFKIVNDTEVDICKKKQKNNSNTFKEMSDISNKHDTCAEIDEKIVDGKIDLEIANKLSKKSKKNNIFNEEILNTPSKDEVSTISNVENIEEDAGISSSQHENRYSIQIMKISEFKKLLDPSLINFRNSNLHKIKGYGCI